MNFSSKSAQGDEIPKVEEEVEGGGKGSGNEISDESVNQEDDEAEENGDEETDATEVADMFLKRKRYTSLRTTTKKAKAGIAYPIPELKMKADLLKEFGDPAMVDQLLEELDGDVSPGGTRRLRRCRNAEGAIEYWVEDADLVNIRKEAGVNDPYCVPSPGWRSGDCPTQQISILKREVELIAKTLEEFKKEVRALMEENLSMFSALFSEIKKKFLLAKEDEKQGMQGVMRKKEEEEEERSSDAQYEA